MGGYPTPTIIRYWTGREVGFMKSSKTQGRLMKELKIDQLVFLLAFGRDDDYHEPYPINTYLDLATGSTVWVYEEDNDAEMEGLSATENGELRNRVEAKPSNFLRVPGLNHGDHHDILRAFLDSDWTDDDKLRKITSEAYFGSIGGWKKAINNEKIFHAFCNFQQQRTAELAYEFLLNNGIKVDWA